MGTNNSANQDYQNNADGAQIGGGIVKRVLKWLSGDITLTGGNSNDYTFPAASDTLVGRDSTDTLTGKTISALDNTITDLDSSTLAESAVKPINMDTHVAVGVISPSSTGNLSVTGVGFKPQSVEFWFRPGTSNGPAYYGYGIMTANGQFTHSSFASTSATRRYDSTTSCYSATNNSAIISEGAYVSMDSDGFTVNVLTAGSSFDWVARG